MLHDLSDWLIDFATSSWAVAALAVSSFAEAIFFPIPPDPLLIAMGVLQPNLAIVFGIIVTVSSVAGALVGHWLGKRFGQPLLYRWFPDRLVDTAETLLARYGVWATLIAAFTPVPYKVFAISAGALDLDRRTFLLASVIGRGVRFISIGALIFLFGESIEDFATGNFELIMIVLGVAVVGGVIALAVWNRSRARHETVATGGGDETISTGDD